MGFLNKIIKTGKKAANIFDVKINKMLDSLTDIQTRFAITKSNMQDKLKQSVTKIEDAKVSRDQMQRAIDKLKDGDKIKESMIAKLDMINKNIKKAEKNCIELKKQIMDIDEKQVEYSTQINALNAIKETMSTLSDFDGNFEEEFTINALIEEGEKEISRLNAQIESIDLLDI